MMKKTSFPFALLMLAAVLVEADVLPHIGYVYPAGGRPGETVTVTIGGQYIKETDRIVISGRTMESEILEYTYEVDQKKNNNLRNMKEKIEAAMTNDLDEVTRSQMQYQLDQIAGEMDMAMMMRKEMRKNPGEAKKKQFNPQLAEQLTVRLALPADMPPGATELRLIATNGISNPMVFCIGDALPEVVETDPGTTPDKAERLPELPLVLNGQIMPGDVDWFRFHAEEGQTLVFRVLARALIPYLADAVPGWFQAVLTLYDADGTELACCDDWYFDPDPVLIFKIPADGDYLLKIHDSIYRGRRDFVYRIEMGELPFIQSIFPLGGPEHAETTVQLNGVNLPRTRMTGGYTESLQVESGGIRSNSRRFQVDELPEQTEASGEQPQPVSMPVIINGRIEQPGDSDIFSFEGRRGEQVELSVSARKLGSPLDARLILCDPDGNILSIGDDRPDRAEGLVTHHADACIITNLPSAGTYTVRLGDLQGKGGEAYAYRLQISRSEPDFCLRVTPSGLRLPRDGSAVATVHVIRQNGFNGPVSIHLADAPGGISMENAVIPEGRESVKITLSAAGNIDDDLASLQIEGEAEIGVRSVTRRAVAAEDQMQAFLWRQLVPVEQLLVQITEPDPVTVTLSLPRDGVVEVRPGETFSLPATLSYHGDNRGSVRLELSEPPEWLSLQTKNLSGRYVRDVKCSVSSNAEPGETATLLLIGRFSIMKSEDDPTYNPLLKWMNRKEIEFPVAAVSLKVTD
jgi:hypothetical protein